MESSVFATWSRRSASLQNTSLEAWMVLVHKQSFQPPQTFQPMTSRQQMELPKSRTWRRRRRRRTVLTDSFIKDAIIKGLRDQH